jgi:hypothetical protein
MSEARPGSDLVVGRVEDLLEGRHRAGLHRLTDPAPAAEVARRLTPGGWRTLALALAATSDKAAVLAGFAAAGRFPGWVGANWDALEDALRDLSWVEAPGYVVLVDGWDRFYAAHRRDARALLAVLADVARWWAGQGTPFHVLLRP